jgi:hypothetical protein|tara:strand:+ start:1042 stop:1173 length:132 start_codon:yes stop_codon:yes gene_type:complete
MPTVGGKKYAYTPKGIKQAKAAKKRAGKQMSMAKTQRTARKRG